MEMEIVVFLMLIATAALLSQAVWYEAEQRLLGQMDISSQAAGSITLQPANRVYCMRRVCAYTSFRNTYLNNQKILNPSSINVSLCTHIVYSGVNYEEQSLVPVSEEERNAIVGLKAARPGLKVLLYLYMGQCRYSFFTQKAATESSRNEFADVIIQHLRDHNFDGFVYGCNFYGDRPNNPGPKDALTNLTLALNDKFSQEASGSNKLELVLHVFGANAICDICFDMVTLSTNLDWIAFSPVYLNGFWNGETGPHSPLYPATNPNVMYPDLSVDTSVKHWINKGVPREKLVLELPAYGIESILTSSETGVGAPVSSDWPGHDALIPYYKICEYIGNNATKRYILQQRTPYLVAGNRWISYDDICSLTDKVHYLEKEELGGFYFQMLNYDDFDGESCGQGTFLLLKAVIEACLI